MQKRAIHPVTFPDGLNPLVRTSLAESVYETLLEVIVTGRLVGGTVLSEVKLSQQLQVSRTPVHEAVVRLAGDGLIEQSSGHRLRVARFETNDIIEIYGMRRLLESAAAESATTLLDDATIQTIQRDADLLGDYLSAIDWRERAIAFDMRFHEIIAGAAGSRRLGDDIRRYRRMVRGFCRMSGTLVNLRNARIEHMHIIDAMVARQPQAAREAMAAHIGARQQALLVTMEELRSNSKTDIPITTGLAVARSAGV